ncbi:thioredoxin [Acetonema longum]|uniref:Thioredoxin n=1 Tax=Acetonema longum DSM 6540 TaxID=1009370 RepID=F7NNJ3_9FIRM|nr:thioredoxin [Acetonema longum]EGO62434.1 thioredoxin [Acetonema longum DSM 6540]
MGITSITNANEFTEKVLNSDRPALVDFWAPWCGPCKMVGPEVEAIAQEYADRAVICKVNIDEQAQLAGQYNVMSIPTLVIFKDGREVKRIVGYRPRKELGAALAETMA